MRAYFFDAAGNHVVLGMLQSAGITPEEAFGILRGSERTPLVEHPSDSYCVLCREHRTLRARFWNPDGSFQDLCGDALRCVPQIMADLGEPPERVLVNTRIGPVATLHLGSGMGGVEIPTKGISIEAPNAHEVVVNVGTPHRVRFLSDLDDTSVASLRADWVRANLPEAATFVKVEGAALRIRSFERGVRREIGSSGNAAIAACFAYAHRMPDDARELREVSFGGGRRLRVRFDRDAGTVILYGACRLEFGCDLVTDGERLACCSP
ncbi:MAG: hypothetical protein JW751_27575 [Polyangiaceae bacterium]|nr:hypothetical protein [Polyangiaceae bacterium]